MSNELHSQQLFYYIISLNTKNMNIYFRFFQDSDIVNIVLKSSVKNVWTVTQAFTCAFNVLSSVNDVMLSKVKV